MSRKIIRIALLILFLTVQSVWSATYYISPSGDDTSGDGSSGSPWKTFSKCFGEMTGGDTLNLLNGTYSVTVGTGVISDAGTGCAQPPDGISTSEMTTIQAVNEGEVILDGAGAGSSAQESTGRAFHIGLKAYEQTYIKIQGIKAIGGGRIYNGQYIYIKNCAIRGALLLGSNEHYDSTDYILIEDSWVWGQERGTTSSYEGTHNIWRRVVVRSDGADGSPAISMTAYNSQYVLFQNCIVIDSLHDGYGYADFASAQHDTGSNNWDSLGHEWRGCLSINSDTQGFYFEADGSQSPTYLLSNCVAATTNSVTAAFNFSGDIGTILEYSTAFTTGTWASAVAFVSTNEIVRSMIIKGSGTYYGVNSNDDIDYIDLYGTYSTANYSPSSCGTGCLTSDPESDGSPTSLLYLTRIESGSILEGTGYNSGNYGATILKRWGTTGAFYGDTGYNTITTEDLWPWPNEDRIRTDMIEDYSDSDETRGFCGVGKTLTKYIWQYLGNEIPDSIYGFTKKTFNSESPVTTYNSGASALTLAQ